LAISTIDKLSIYGYNKKSHALTEITTVNDRVTSGCFVDKIFYYMTKSGKLYYTFNGK